MDNLLAELSQMVREMEGLLAHADEIRVRKISNGLETAALEVGNSWSKSWFGYQANVYYRYFKTPEGRAYFNMTQGIIRTGYYKHPTTGDWVEYAPDQIIQEVYKRAGDPDIGPVLAFREEAKQKLQSGKNNLLSIIDIEINQSHSQFLAQAKEELDSLMASDEQELAEGWIPDPPHQTNDLRAMQQGIKIPPHLWVLSTAKSIQSTLATTDNLTKIARQVELHISRRRWASPTTSTGNKVFVGHGRSPIWRELKEFVEHRLGLQADEFNRVSVAGITTTERLGSMLDASGFAFLIMTGEDEQADGKVRARENVVHEAGLFQGRLGFRRAIVILEEGCQEFSNITGLGQIRFPKGNIKAAFEEIRQVIERERIFSG